MANTARRKAAASQSFFTTVFALTLLAVYSLFLQAPAEPERRNDGILHARSAEDCRLVHQAADQCAFVHQNCEDEEAGLISYLHIYYCNLGQVQPLAFIFLIGWAGLLFTTIGVAASDFFSVNLSTIATILGLSESLAGVTFLAFGNGSPDVFSTFAAMSSNSGSMAVGELIGAAGFITSVVAGSMALVREFKVGRKTVVRDILFFILAVAFAMTFLADGNIHLWECCTMIAFYVFYVIVVVGWHAWDTRRKARRDKEAASRGHFNAPGVNGGVDELERYRDDPGDDDDGTADGRNTSAGIDVGRLERGPRIEVDDDASSDSDEDRHAAAEMTNSMRVSRPRGRRSNTVTKAPIRPSLVGALEFRSVLSSLQQEGNVRLRPLHIRSRSDDGMDARFRRQVAGSSDSPALGSPDKIGDVPGVAPTGRNRASSSGDLPSTVDSDIARVKAADENQSRSHSPNTIGGRLAPPQDDFHMGSGHSAEASSLEHALEASARSLHPLHIPAHQGSEASSPALSPFPDYTDSPGLLTPRTDSGGRTLSLPSPAIEQGGVFPSMQDLSTPRPISWWPYHILPPPHVLRDTLFPTLRGWRGKSLWDKIISIVSLPSVFLLVITMPVVDNASTNDEPESPSGPLGNVPPPVSHEPGASIEPETEWQRYRRSTRSREPSRSPVRIAVDGPSDEPQAGNIQVVPPTPALTVQPPRPASSDFGHSSQAGEDDDQSWNRWLLIVQVFLGPLFCVAVVWANFTDGENRRLVLLARSMLISLVCSLVILGLLLLTTSPDRRPKYHYVTCFLGFVIAIAWISTVAGEVVGVMKAFGVIFNISEAILGLTIFAVGNSVGDLVADITIARLGLPMMALSACFGGPLLNILLGIGLGGAYQTIQAANKQHNKHPDLPLKYEPYHIHVTGTLIISAITLLVTLVILLIVLPLNKWIMSRWIGWLLIALWSVSTIVNLVIELTGTWQEVS